MEHLELRDASTEGATRVEAHVGDRVVGHAVGRPVQLFVGETFCDVEVIENARRRGLGTALFAALCSRLPAAQVLVGRVLHDDPAQLGFATSLGYDVIEHCPNPQADPTTPAWQRWAGGQPVPEGANLVGSGEVPEEDVERAWVDYYVWAHEMIGPLRPRADVEAAMAGFGAQIDPDASTLALRGGRVAALCAAMPGILEGRTMVLAETPRVDEPDGVALVAAAIARTLLVLGSRGVRLVQFEGRTFDPHVAAVFDAFPPHDAEPMSVVRLHRRVAQ